MILLNSSQGSGFTTLIFFGLIFAIMYFFMIRPQVKKQKKEHAFREALKKGDKVVTVGGIHGKIVEISKTTVIIEVYGENRIKIEKSSISMFGGTQLQQQ